MSVITIRSHKRYAVRQPVLLANPSATEANGLLIELSSEGCRISNLGRAAFAVGEPVTVKVDEIDLKGRIRWSHDGIAGVRLDNALYPSQLGELVARGRGESQEVRRYGT